MKRMAFIEQTIVVDDNSPWRNISHFERFFEDFCTAHGMEVEPVEVSGNSNKKVYFISKVDDPPRINPNPMTFKKPTNVK